MSKRELPGKVNVGIDDRKGDHGDTSIITPDRPKTLAEMARLFKIDLNEWTAIGFTANEWQGFYKVRDGNNHRKVSLWQTRVSWRRNVPGSVEAGIRKFIQDTIKPLPAPKSRPYQKHENGQVVSWGIWDAHLGMYAWHSEVGESYDLGIAVSRITNSIDDIARELQGYPIEKVWMPIGNDFLHYDNVKAKTTHGDHQLDADGRYAKAYSAALRCLCYQIDTALKLCDDVEVIYVPGNHDYITSYTLCVALAQRYLNDPRVKFDLSANPRKYRQFGGTLLGFEHGKDVKPNQMALIFATECKNIWSQTSYREVQVGHTHQRWERKYDSVIPTNGVLIRTNPALCNLDYYHHSTGLIGEPVKSVEAWRYDRTGYRGSHVAWARDEKNEVLKDILVTRRTS